MPDFTGKWFTSFGPMTIAQTGDRVTGTYGRTEPLSQIEGIIRGGRLEFDYTESREQGSGWFEMVRNGRFVGEYVSGGAPHPRPWNGNRGFDGIWSTSLGTMRLVQDGGQVLCHFADGGACEGQIDDGKLKLRNLLPGQPNTATCELLAEDFELKGACVLDGATTGVEFNGFRLLPEPRTVWLIVLEAHWQRSLAEREFAFGDMLDEIFARLPHVHVRHRYFDDADGLLHWCHALQFLPEPVVLVVTSHGEPDGLYVRGKIIDTRPVLGALQLADSLQLVHFSSCLIAKNDDRGLANPCFPVSGYTSSVDWMASALTEFTYLDMILAKGLTPSTAAAQLYRLIGFAGAEVPADCPYPAAGFKMFERVRAGDSVGQGTLVAAAGGAPLARGSATGFLERLQDLRRMFTAGR